jgi:hypothetical protein
MGLISKYFHEDKQIVARFVRYAFEENPNIQDLSEFRDAFFESFGTEKGTHALNNIEEEDIITLFESDQCKNQIKKNVSDKEYHALYGDGVFVKRVVSGVRNPKIVTITHKKIQRKEYTRTFKGRKLTVKGYASTRQKWTEPELKFIRARKQRKVSVKNTVAEFNAHFKGQERTSSSIKTKMYRG